MLGDCHVPVGDRKPPFGNRAPFSDQGTAPRPFPAQVQALDDTQPEVSAIRSPKRDFNRLPVRNQPTLPLIEAPTRGREARLRSLSLG